MIIVKKLLFLFCSFCLFSCSSSNAPLFLGIPVDGSRHVFKQNLMSQGFEVSSDDGEGIALLSGEYNDQMAHISVAYGKWDKVIMATLNVFSWDVKDSYTMVKDSLVSYYGEPYSTKEENESKVETWVFGVSDDYSAFVELSSTTRETEMSPIEMPGFGGHTISFTPKLTHMSSFELKAVNLDNYNKYYQKK